MKLSDLNSYTKAEIRALSLPILERAVRRASSLYYDKGKSPLSDSVFDMLEDALERKDKNNPALTSVGTPQKRTRNKVKLPYPLFSLNKIRPEHAPRLSKWLETYPGPYVISLKEDGISLEITYKNGRLDRILTRGDGTVGQDVTHLGQWLKIPKKVRGIEAVRAELVMPESKFKKLAADAANARNYVAGLTNRLNGDVSQLAHADVLAYEVIAPRVYKTSKAFALLENNKFETPNWRVVRSVSAASLAKMFVASRAQSPHLIDGLVIEHDAVNKRPNAGDHAPNYAFAFKMQSEDDAATVPVVDVKWQESKHGRYQPVIVIPPTKLAGVTVTNVSGHNGYFIEHGYRLKDKNKGLPLRHIGKGARIRVIRSGDVIPHITEVVKGAKSPLMPAGNWHWDASGVNVIMSDKTDTVRDKRITAFFTALGVDGIKLGVVQQLTEAGFDSIIKILRASASDFETVPGFKARKAEKLYSSIREKTAHAPLHLLMAGSGHFGLGLGSRRFEDIIKAYPRLMTTWPKLSTAQIKAKVSAIDGFQDKTASIFASGFPKFVRWLAKTKIKPELPRAIKAKTSKLSGQAVCFTGVRDKGLERAIVENGGTIASGVSAKTTILIAAPGKTSSKLTKAQELGIPVYSIPQFQKKFKL